MTGAKLERMRILGKETSGRMDFSSVAVSFCDDRDIEGFYERKDKEWRDFEEWKRKNSERMVAARERIRAAVSAGILADENPETIWNFEKEEMCRKKEMVSGRRDELAQRREELLRLCEERLWQWLPDWTPRGGVEIYFVLNEKANFWVDGKKIGADLLRMADQTDFFERTVCGICHELFHVWMFEGLEEAKEYTPREKILYRIVDEGLAVFVSGQSLREHHESQGREYDEYKKESFDFFEKFRETEDEEVLREMQKEGFEASGYFYVFGYETVRELFEEMGAARFREMMQTVRDDPKRIFEL